MNGQRKVQKTEKNPCNHLSKICKELINLGDMFAMPPSVTATEQETVKSLPPPKVTLNVNGRAGHGAQASGSFL